MPEVLETRTDREAMSGPPVIVMSRMLALSAVMLAPEQATVPVVVAVFVCTFNGSAAVPINCNVVVTVVVVALTNWMVRAVAPDPAGTRIWVKVFAPEMNRVPRPAAGHDRIPYVLPFPENVLELVELSDRTIVEPVAVIVFVDPDRFHAVPAAVQVTVEFVMFVVRDVDPDEAKTVQDTALPFVANVPAVCVIVEVQVNASCNVQVPVDVNEIGHGMLMPAEVNVQEADELANVRMPEV